MHATLTRSWNGCLSRPARIHLVGVAGAGVGPLARLLLLLGHQVSGSDRRRTAAIEDLEELGLRFSCGHDGGVPEGVDLLVYSSAVREDNPERKIAVARGIPTARRADLLQELCRTKKSIVVAGMHGKTTTTALLAHILRQSGWEPSYYVGGDVPVLGPSSDWGKGDYMVIEGDESDGTLASFQPTHAVLLNVEEEHLDFYPGMDAILEVFATFLNRCSGKIIYCADDPYASKLCAHRENAVSYGLGSGGRYRAESVKLKPFESTFLLVDEGRPLGEIRLPLPGSQNVQNALAGIALSLELGLPLGDIGAAMAGFRGVKRRFEVLFAGSSFLVVDDYAHHPTEIRATLAAARGAGRRRVVALFQPHRYSRAHGLEKGFATAFRGADLVLVTEIYGAGEKPIEGVNSERLAHTIAEGSGVEVLSARTPSETRRRAAAALRPGDLFLALGAGDVHRVARALAGQCSLYEEMRRSLSPSAILAMEEPLGKHTSSGLGGPAEFWCEPATRQDVCRLAKIACREKISLNVVGMGTGSLVREGGMRGICLSLRHPSFCRVVVEDGRVEAGGGTSLSSLGAGVCGTVGGALIRGVDRLERRLAHRIEKIVLIDREGEVRTLLRHDLQALSKRGSLAHLGVVVGVSFRTAPGTKAAASVASMRSARVEADPEMTGRWLEGIFRTAEGGEIDDVWAEIGSEGIAVGGASVNPRVPNRIQLRDEVKIADVLAIVEIVRQLCRKREVNVVCDLAVLGDEENS
ncbi:UDP-N-acetylmuramate--L-alanine ligase [Methylacidimicrobium cyclopophantes]|uniref:UDP-N-acetylmuramate--L-alanine ligase n=1 Tax=Methylacidimicrobium cyclopophantes TaxID=1041766 RepID=A0A5E6MI85_9BACT|nr:UDP-N-acetylmuramate--L-alanine ligase [Methylacidimicrobium cyclopophantes]VVM05756.1 UDP-N-acetylmuramate--L-alanine ligase [Methylacidimicrobium cyclopophantes]